LSGGQGRADALGAGRGAGPDRRAAGALARPYRPRGLRPFAAAPRRRCLRHLAMSARPHPWEASYPPGLDWGKPIETTTVQALLDRSVALCPRRSALVFRDWRMSYAELAEAADRFAAAVLAAGLGGAKVALLLPNSPWHPV